MAKGNSIIVSVEPQGRFEECIVSGTPVPGTLMEVVPATVPVGGRMTYRHASRTAGSKGPVAVLLPDSMQGKLGVGAAAAFGGGNAALVGDAYVTATRGFLYWPVAGEELNLPVLDIAGTADDVAIGDLFGVEATAGMLHANSAYGSAPFMAMEAVTDPTSNYMLWVKYLGNEA